jgi:hypothetical protein
LFVVGCDFLGHCSMFRSRAAAERFFQMIGNVSPDENSFTVCHRLRFLLGRYLKRQASEEQVCKPNSVSRRIGMAIIHLGQLLPNGSSDLPGGRPRRIGVGRAALITPPYLVLHREEFAWPRMSPHAPVRSYIKPRRAAPFHPSPSA